LDILRFCRSLLNPGPAIEAVDLIEMKISTWGVNAFFGGSGLAAQEQG
jgi:hypothetical protein